MVPKPMLPLLAALLMCGVSMAQAQEDGMPEGATFENGLGMRFVRVAPGSFEMGQERGAGWADVGVLDRASAEAWIDSTTHTDWDEVPAREVMISRPFYLQTTEVTNAQYEQFDPDHRALRGKRGFSASDDEAAVFVTWEEAAAFCRWLSEEEGRPYLGGEDAGRYADVVLEHMEPLEPQGIIVRDAEGHERRVYGLFAALSFDEGETWPVKKLLTPGGTPRVIDCYGWVEDCYVDDTHAEIGGYLAEAQTPDGTIHLLSSGLHYRFNLPWLLEPMPAGECGKFGEFGKGRAGAEWVEWEERGEWGVWEGRRGV